MGLDAVALILSVEEAFGVEIPDDVAATLLTSNNHDQPWMESADQLARASSQSHRVKNPGLIPPSKNTFGEGVGNDRSRFKQT